MAKSPPKKIIHKGKDFRLLSGPWEKVDSLQTMSLIKNLEDEGFPCVTKTHPDGDYIYRTADGWKDGHKQPYIHKDPDPKEIVNSIRKRRILQEYIQNPIKLFSGCLLNGSRASQSLQP